MRLWPTSTPDYKWPAHFLSPGMAAVRFLLDFVSRHGFAPFAWWRIAVGGAGLAALFWHG